LFTEQPVRDALNNAGDDILDAVAAGDEGLRDAISLLVNATISYLLGEADHLSGVVAASYGEDYETRVPDHGESAPRRDGPSIGRSRPPH
jgi:hypothetical protein